MTSRMRVKEREQEQDFFFFLQRCKTSQGEGRWERSDIRDYVSSPLFPTNSQH